VRTTWLVMAAWLVGHSMCPAQSASELLSEGSRLFERRQLEAAQQVFERALERALEEDSRRDQGSAHFGLGKVLLNRARYPAARAELEQALAIFESESDRARTGRIRKDLGYVAWAQGNRPEAGALYRQALADFEATGDRQERVSTIYNLAFIMPPGSEKRQLLRDGTDLARALENRRVEGLLLHAWGDTDYAEGDFAAAAEKLDRAAKLLDQEDARRELARVYTSMGRLFRQAGHPESSLDLNRRARSILEALGDQQGVIQSIDAMAIAYGELGDRQQAIEQYELALDLARRTGSASLVSRQLAHLAYMHIELREFGRAVEMLEAATRGQEPSASSHLQYLGQAYLGLGRHAEALAAAEKSVEAANRLAPAPDALAGALECRARAKEALGRTAEALSDAQEALRSLERLRARLVPTDYMRNGFSAQHQGLISYIIDLLYRAGQHDRALEAAEHGRARAFLDLLATRELDPGRADSAQVAALRDVERGLQEKGVDPAEIARPATAAPVLRGGDAATAALWQKWQTAGSDVKSLVSAPPFSVAEATAAAARLRSTLVAYWVAPDVTYVWVVAPGQPVRAARVAVSADQLRQWIAATTAVDQPGRQLAGREGRAVDAGDEAREPWRRLYDVLIRPVRAWLPGVAGSRLTLVPHGPLFLVSFAALLDEKGQYLVERFALHSVPAAAVLEFTGRRKQAVVGRPPRYLLVADPTGMPSSPRGPALPQLPGSRREVAEVARLAPPNSTTVLAGDAATVETVRAMAPGKTVLHFATHAIVRDDQPFDSFLALGGEGRLTAQTVYGLNLSADLVVLSGCRTGLGRISGDGIVGLTRAFFYAGTPSVVATQWEVADESTYLLVTEFYRSLRRTGDKARALRDAQLSLLGALRRGEVKVRSAFGTVTLPEHPLLWAGFVLQGEP
jgi:CHAT domain-containing protein/tetratricopeptide (TPR) repeat protein